MSKDFFSIDNLWVLIGIPASIIAIGTFIYNIIKRKRTIKNKLEGVSIGKDFVGGDNKPTKVTSKEIENDLKETNIQGNYTGGDEN